MQLTTEQCDALQEIVNIGVGRAAASLSDMVDEVVQLTIPSVHILEAEEQDPLGEIEEKGQLSAISQKFDGMVSGEAVLIFPSISAVSLVLLLVGEELDEDELDAEREAALTEVGNILINGVMGSLANVLDTDLDFSLPHYLEKDREGLAKRWGENNKSMMVVVDVDFRVKSHDITGSMAIAFNMSGVSSMFEKIGI